MPRFFSWNVTFICHKCLSRERVHTPYTHTHTHKTTNIFRICIFSRYFTFAGNIIFIILCVCTYLCQNKPTKLVKQLLFCLCAIGCVCVFTGCSGKCAYTSSTPLKTSFPKPFSWIHFACYYYSCMILLLLLWVHEFIIISDMRLIE